MLGLFGLGCCCPGVPFGVRNTVTFGGMFPLGLAKSASVVLAGKGVVVGGLAGTMFGLTQHIGA